MTAPMVSVIVPTFNSARFLRECLDSIFRQNYPEFEIVIVDDGSTDGTLDLAGSYGRAIRIISKKRDKRLFVPELARYEGVMESRGKYCAFIDSDDVWCDGKLKAQVDFLEDHPDIPLCHAYMRNIDENGKQYGIRHEGAIPITGYCAKKLLRHCFISISSVVVKRASWLHCFGLRDFDGYPNEWHFCIQIARQHRVGFIPDVKGLYRWAVGSHSHGRWRQSPNDVNAVLWALRHDLWREVVPRREMRKIYLDACVDSCRFWRIHRYPERAVYFALRALRFSPLHFAGWLELAKSLLKSLSLR